MSNPDEITRNWRSPVRVAIVGTGGIARIHLEALRELNDRALVVAAVDIDGDRARSFANRHGIAHAGTDLRRAMAQTAPDLVHVCTPPGAHADPAREALAAGAHVLVEKPPALSLRELDELATAGAFGTVFQHRFGSGARRLRALLAAGVLGRPLLAVCETSWYRTQEYYDVPWRGRWDTEGGGPTMGHGIHQMDLMLAVLGDWAEVRAVARRQARRVDTEDVSLAHVTFDSGAVATVVNSVVSPREESRLRFDFEHATVEVTHLYGYGDDDWRIAPAPGHEERVALAWKAGAAGVASGHRAQFDEVLAAVAGGAPPPVEVAEARRTLSLVAGIYASAFTGRPVTPADLGPGSVFYDRMQGSGPPWEMA
ncbi:Gfo/Idh/MocA family oxidoreductase [Dactylosporangium darangshiense]|uniref:Gfo/Idh/MocA family oxidoreductase n=1 Tax=Dactylosporangium darangshiense TaxID=579108 RepID=A0ABP8D7K4_9ACTN